MLKSKGIHILDGGFATEVLRQKLWSPELQEMDDDPLWSSRLLQTDPNATKTVHLKFLEAGSDIVESNTYQASIGGFKKYLNMSEEEAITLLVTGIKVAQEAVHEFMATETFRSSGREPPKVAASVGPYGVALHDGSEYSGHYLDNMSVKELQDWHRPKLQAMVAAGAELLAFETIPGVKEAEALVGLLEEFPGVKAWLSFACKDEVHTCHGESFASAIQVAAQSDKIVAVGINCSRPEIIGPLLGSARGFVKDFIVYPNSGEVWVDKRWYGKTSCLPLWEYVPAWLDLGVKWIGGCCRVSPDDISNMRQVAETHTLM